jgi:hypothetical protein
MPWWHPWRPERSDDEIAKHIKAEVKAGRIPLALAHLYEKAWRDEADGKATIMRDPKIVRKFPKPRDWS